MTDEPLDHLARIVGKRVEAVRRIHFLFQTDLDTSRGPLELLLEEGECVHFSGKGDGQTLGVRWEAWQDPFATEIDAANREFVRAHGKWTKVDAAADPVLGKCVGNTIRRLDVVCVEGAVNGGLRFTIADLVFYFVVAGDEDYVLGADDSRVSEWRVSVDPHARSYGV